MLYVYTFSFLSMILYYLSMIHMILGGGFAYYMHSFVQLLFMNKTFLVMNALPSTFHFKYLMWGILEAIFRMLWILRCLLHHFKLILIRKRMHNKLLTRFLDIYFVFKFAKTAIKCFILFLLDYINFVKLYKFVRLYKLY